MSAERIRELEAENKVLTHVGLMAAGVMGALVSDDEMGLRESPARYRVLEVLKDAARKKLREGDPT